MEKILRQKFSFKKVGNKMVVVWREATNPVRYDWFVEGNEDPTGNFRFLNSEDAYRDAERVLEEKGEVERGGGLNGKRELQKGDVVQISPECAQKEFAGCFMVVSEPKSFGAQGYMVVPSVSSSGLAYFRCNFEDMEFIGKAVFDLE